MRHTDLLTAESHLNQAVRHLATAEVLVLQLDAAAELSATDRRGLSRAVSVARDRLDAIADALAGRGFEREFAALIGGPTADQDARP